MFVLQPFFPSSPALCRIHIMMALFPRPTLPATSRMFLCFSEEWKGSSSSSSSHGGEDEKRGIKSKSYTQRERMVMPDAICVPNNNKAIHHLQYVMLFVVSHPQNALCLFLVFFSFLSTGCDVGAVRCSLCLPFFLPLSPSSPQLHRQISDII